MAALSTGAMSILVHSCELEILRSRSSDDNQEQKCQK